MIILETDQTGQVVREDQSTRIDQIVTTGNKFQSLCFFNFKNKIYLFFFLNAIRIDRGFANG